MLPTAMKLMRSITDANLNSGNLGWEAAKPENTNHKNVKIDKHSSFTVMPPSPTYTQQPKAKPTAK